MFCVCWECTSYQVKVDAGSALAQRLVLAVTNRPTELWQVASIETQRVWQCVHITDIASVHTRVTLHWPITTHLHAA